MAEKLLFIGGAYADIPLIQAAKRLGYRVATTGNRADAPGHQHSDEYHAVDFSDLAAVLELARRLDVGAVASGCNDFCALAAAYVAEEMGLPGHDSHAVAQIIHHKDAYRKFAIEHGIPTPAARGFSNADDALDWMRSQRFPLIIKPVDLGSGRGISVAESIPDAEAMLETAFALSKAKRVVVEEFIEGSRHGLSAFLCKGKVVFSFFDNEHYHLNPYLVSGASTPGVVPASARAVLLGEAERIASILKLKDGIFHVQFILRGGQPFIIEICRRPPGDLYVSLVSHATGIDYPAWIINAAVGRDCGELTHVEPRGFHVRHCIMGDREGVFSGIAFDASIEANIIGKSIISKPGEQVLDALTHRFGIVFLQFSSMAEMLDKTERMQSLIRAEVQ